MGKRLTIKRVVDALHETKGSVYIAAKRLDCSHTSIYKYINDYESVAEIKAFYDGELTDIAQLKHREKILGGDWPAIKYQLATKGKDRGYTERVEQSVEHSGGIDITAKVESAIDKAYGNE